MRLALIPHPDAASASIRTVEVELLVDPGDDVALRYLVRGGDLLLPEWSVGGRADGLWETTCFELFLRDPVGGAYFEFNFSPSSRWAAYRFDRYRQGRRDMTLSVDPYVNPRPDTEAEDGESGYALEAEIDLSDLPDVLLQMAVSAVIEELDGTKSYWALAHPPGEPDFHHPDCFVLELPPPDTA